MRDVFGVPGAVAGLVFFVIALGGIDSGTNMTEQYALPLAWGSALALVRWTRARDAAVGTGFALEHSGRSPSCSARTSRGSAASAALTIALVLLIEKRVAPLLRAALGIVAGATVVSAPILAWLAHAGALRAFWDQAIVYNLLYAHADWTQRVLACARGGLARHRHRATAASHRRPVPLRATAEPSACARPSRSALRARLDLIELLLASCRAAYDHYFMMLSHRCRC